MKLCEVYKSIIGEGSYSGKLGVIVRLTGCNLRCSWCDTQYAYEEGNDVTVDALLERIESYNLDRVLITGGEPLIQDDVYLLMEELGSSNKKLILETNGSIDISKVPDTVHRIVDMKPPGSGMTDRIEWTNLQLVNSRDDVKFVILDKNDFEWSKEVVLKNDLIERTNVIFQPVWNELEPKRLAEWILQYDLNVKFGIQLHKVLWGNKRGV